MNAPQVTVGLIGAGRIGKLHAQHLACRVPGASLIAVADVVPQAAASCGTECEVPHVLTDYHQLLDMPEIDAVLVCTRTPTHVQIVEDAAAAGKHIFCEKPLAFDLAEIDLMLSAVQRAGVKLQVGFNRRFDANFKRVHDLVASGKIGGPQIVRITSRDPEPPSLEYLRSSGGLFLDQTIHDWDMARFLIGSEVRELYAAAEALVDPAIGEMGDVDTAVVTLRYENGAIGCIDNSRRAAYGYDQRVEVLGSKGLISVSNIKTDAVKCGMADGVHSSPAVFFFAQRYIEAYIAEMRAFIECVQQDRPPPVGGADARAAVLMAHAAKRSLVENRPVRLDEVGAS